MMGSGASLVVGSMRITCRDGVLIEGRDFTVDYSNGIVEFHEQAPGGLVTLSSVVSRPARIKGGAQWKREIRGRRP